LGKIERFEDIEAWKKARFLVQKVYQICRIEVYKKDYNLVEQTRRAAVSIMANIAEGFARRTNKEFINFLGMSHGSAAELQSHFYIALDQQYFTKKDFQLLYALTEEVSKMIQGFSNYLRSSSTLKLPNSKTI
jgi:four helix bundle protein